MLIDNHNKLLIKNIRKQKYSALKITKITKSYDIIIIIDKQQTIGLNMYAEIEEFKFDQTS